MFPGAAERHMERMISIAREISIAIERSSIIIYRVCMGATVTVIIPTSM